MKLLYVTQTNFSKEHYGAAAGELARHNIFIKALSSDTYFNTSIEENHFKIQRVLDNVLCGRLHSLDSSQKVVDIVNTQNIDIVLIETTKYGQLVRNLTKKTKAKVIVYANDIDRDRIQQLIKISIKSRNFYETIRQLFIYRATVKSERMVAKYAHKLITFHMRDSQLFKDYYGRYSDFCVPVAVTDKINIAVKEDNDVVNAEKQLLFVGVGKYQPNYEGILWFTENVLPYINAKLTIVGKETKDAWPQLKNNRKLDIVGEVESLDEYYDSADAVICPLLSGGGMKFKVIEALMYGKNIFGTNEAFIGIEGDYSKIGALCNTSEDFVSAINECNLKKYNRYSRELFQTQYSTEAVGKKLIGVLGQIMEEKDNDHH